MAQATAPILDSTQVWMPFRIVYGRYRMSSGAKALNVASDMKYELDNGACRNGEGV